MNRLAEVLNRSVPNLAVSVADKLDDPELARVFGAADVIEFRADKFRPQVTEALTAETRRLAAAVPLIATVRTAYEGGNWVRPDDERADLFRALMDSADGLDVELAAPLLQEILAIARQAGKVAIVSKHFLHEPPSLADLEETYAAANDAGADFVKLAASDESADGFVNMAIFNALHKGENVIDVAMADYGSRVLFPLNGHSRLTYAYAGYGPIADGQLHYSDARFLLDLYDT